MITPGLHTERLVLRGPELGDFPDYQSFYADAEASRFYGGPLPPGEAWRKLAYDIGHWTLRGFGIWSVVQRDTDQMVGGCGIVWPEGWPRHELTWWISPDFRRRGFAEEASKAVIAWAYDKLGWETVETHMKDDNSAARALAEKLGGKVMAREPFPDGVVRSIYSLPGA